MEGFRQVIVKRPDDKQKALAELRRLLSEDHGHRTQKRIQKAIDDIIDGETGERDTAYHLDAAVASCPEHMVVHDLVIAHDGVDVQIDHLVFTRRRQVFVLETKAINGTLRFDADGTCTAVYDSGKRFQMPSPIEQVRRHATVLRSWLGATGSTMREVVPVVVVQPRTRLKMEMTIDDVEIVSSDLLPSRIRQREIERGDRYVVVRSDEAPAEEVAGAAWLASQAHRPRDTDWARNVGVVSTPTPIKTGQLFDLPEQRASNTVSQARDDMHRQDAEAVSKAVTIPVALHQGTIDTYDRGDGRTSLKWRGNSNGHARFGDECRSHGGVYNARGFWTLSEESARRAIERLKKPPVVQGDMFEPIDITIPESLKTSNAAGRVDTPQGSVDILHQPGAMSRIPGHGMSPQLAAHVRAICSGRAKRDAESDAWLLPDAMRDAIIRDLAMPAVRIAS